MANKATVAGHEFEVRTQLVDIELATPGMQAVLYQADREGRFLEQADLLPLACLQQDLALAEALNVLREQADDIVNAARTDLLAHFPDITEPSGGLYPEARAIACWRDLWHFLRCITYGIVIGHSPYTNAHGLARLRQLYYRLEVPLDAMVAALVALKRHSLVRLSSQQAIQQAPFFDHLIEQLQEFQVATER
ncbi:MAG: phycobilisome protein [Cyanobacteria bacterium Co-bin8]|nr:phycobilisome protein [Cyanobacteria bacterium Co-bin8]